MIDVTKLDLKPGDILAITFGDDLDGDTFERVAAQIAPVVSKLGVLALFLERATPVVVRPDNGAVLAVDRAGLLEALRVLLDVESIEDRVYDVRDRAAGNSWDHPRVKAFSGAIGVLRALQAALVVPEVQTVDETY